MPYNSFGGNNRSNPVQGAGRGNQQGGGQYSNQSRLPAEIRPMPIPEDYVDAAENVMRTIHSNRSCITTTKMRGFLTLVNDIYNVESLRFDEKISPESKLKIMRLRVRMVYDAGREKDVKTFIEQARLLEYLKGVGDNREKMIRYAHYMEALVAYHRYLGGSDK